MYYNYSGLKNNKRICMDNNISIIKYGVSNIAFRGTIHNSAKRIFKNLCNEVTSFENYHGETIKSIDVYKKVSDYMAKTDKDTELFWKKLRFSDIFKSNRYEGFMFRNKATKKEIRGSKYPFMSDFNVFHLSEKYIDEFGVTAQAPNLPDRVEITGYKSPFIEKLHKIFNEEERYVIGGESYYRKSSPTLGFLTGVIRKVIGIFPQKRTIHYGVGELHNINKWVEELTTHTEPRDVDKLLGVDSANFFNKIF